MEEREKPASERAPPKYLSRCGKILRKSTASARLRAVDVI